MAIECDQQTWHVVNLKIDIVQEGMFKYIQWCSNNCTDKWDFMFLSNKFLFKNNEDAAFFILTHG